MKKLFGTDGIRAVAGQSPLDPSTVYAIGLALAHTLKASTPSPRVLLGMDTRESSEAIAATLTAALDAGGASVENAGVITTPAVAHLTHAPRLRHRRRHLRLAQSLAGQRHQALWSRRLQAPRRHRTRHRSRDLPAVEQSGCPASRLRPRQRAPPVNEADRAEYTRFLLAAVPGLSLDNHTIVDRLR